MLDMLDFLLQDAKITRQKQSQTALVPIFSSHCVPFRSVAHCCWIPGSDHAAGQRKT